jgi:hypothetical protein
MNPEDIPLRDLHLPALTGWWPLAPGWWLLIALLLSVLAWLLRRSYRHWRANAARRLALHRLAAIRREFEDGADPVSLGKSLSELLRRAMLAYRPRDEVAGLTGAAWLVWLDQGLDGKPFSRGAGRILETLPYRDPGRVEDETDVHGLIDAVRTRLQTPLPGASN